MLFDTHAHVNFKSFAEDAKETIKRALDAGVWVNNVGTQIDTSRQAVELAEQYDKGVHAIIGLHPVHTYSQHVDEEETSFKTREEKFDYEAYKKIGQSSKVVGVGECGLDYFRLKIEDLGFKIDEVKQLQKDAFIAQINLAKELDKALVIHCRPSVGTQDAYEDILKILDEELISRSADKPISFEIHSFTGSPAIVKEFLNRGAFVGLNGIITFDKTGNMAEVVKTVPLDRIVLETDSPYLTPVPHRGKRNEPAYVKHVAEKVADIKKISIHDVTKVTSENAKNLFKL